MHNRGPERAPASAAGAVVSQPLLQPVQKPVLAADGGAIVARHPNLVSHLGAKAHRSCCSPTTRPTTGVCSAASPSSFVKDATTTSRCTGGPTPTSAAIGIKAAAHYRLEIAAGGSASVRLRLRPAATGVASAHSFNRTARRRAEADTFYRALSWPILDEDGVDRQFWLGCAGKQHYHYDVALAGAAWRLALSGEQRRTVRNAEWFHMANDDAHLHAGQVGVSLVRHLGPWLSLLALVLVDRILPKRQLSHAVGRLLPSELASRRRMRSQSTDPALGGLFHLRDRQGAQRRGR